MKKSALFILVMILFVAGSGQSIVTADKVWYNDISYYHISWPPVDGMEHLRFSADTVFNGETYKVVERSLDTSPDTWLPYGFIREDPGKKIFYKMNLPDTARMLYDLNAVKHTTIKAYSLETSLGYKSLQGLTYWVREIDSILIGQTYNKRINLTTPNDTSYIMEQWIDSIGSLGGMLHNNYELVGGDYYNLQCFYKDGLLVYNKPESYDCSLILATAGKKPESPAVTISPNPVTCISYLEITGVTSPGLIRLRIFNVFGKEIYSTYSKNRFVIHREDFLPGLYFFSVMLDGESIRSGKMIVN